jgi:hypothetical protein
MVEPFLLVHLNDPAEFCAVLEKTPRSGEEPSVLRIDTRVTRAAQSIKQLSKTGVKLEDVVR